VKKEKEIPLKRFAVGEGDLPEWAWRDLPQIVWDLL
jgi:hypothetical protein